MAKTKSKPTLEDIANHAGVSITTVSRVINQSGPVKKELQIRVKQAMKELGRVKTRPDVIACIVPGLLNPANTTIIAGAQEEAERKGVGLFLIYVSEDQGSQQYNLKLLKHFVFDAFMLLHPFLTAKQVFEHYGRSDLPFVWLNRSVETPHVHCINTNRENAMYQATKYLLSLEHRDIAFVSGRPESELVHVRLRGIRQALNEVDLSLNPQWHRWGDSTIDEGFRVTSSILQLPPEDRPTAILAYNDLMAIGALHAIRSASLKVPDDMSVVGFDDIHLALHTNPPLTTVAQPQYRIGQLAIQKLYDSLNGYEMNTEGVTLLECSLVVRESTGPCTRRL